MLLTDDLPEEVIGLQQHVEGKPCVGQRRELEGVLKHVGALQVTGGGDAAV